MLLHSIEPLFQKFMCMSGNTLMLKPIPPPLTEFVYTIVVQAFGLEGVSGSERVKAVVNMPTEKLLALTPPGLPLLPVIDGKFIPGPATFKQVSSKSDDPSYPFPGRHWCKELLVGDCQFDVSHPQPSPRQSH